MTSIDLDEYLGLWIKNNIYLYNGESRIYKDIVPNLQNCDKVQKWFLPNLDITQLNQYNDKYNKLKKNGRNFYIVKNLPLPKINKLEYSISNKHLNQSIILSEFGNKWYNMYYLICSMLKMNNMNNVYENIRYILSRKQTCESMGIKISKSLIKIAATRIFADPEQSILELPVNSLDAYNKNQKIGKFGMGFFSFLYWLIDHPLRSIVIKSWFNSNNNTQIEHYICTIKELDGNLSFNLSVLPTKVNTTGVYIELNCEKDPLDNNKEFQKQLQKLVNTKSSLISVNGEIINQGPKNYENVNVIFSNKKIIVEDYATGISLDILFNSLFIPSISSKTISISNTKTLSSFTNNSSIKEHTENMFYILVGEIGVVQLPYITTFNKKYKIIIDMPINTTIPVSRDDIILGDKSQYLIDGLNIIVKSSYNLQFGIIPLQQALKSYITYTTQLQTKKVIEDFMSLKSSNDILFVPYNKVYSIISNLLKENKERYNIIKKYDKKIFVASLSFNIYQIEEYFDKILNSNSEIYLGKKVIFTTVENLIDDANLLTYLFIDKDYAKKDNWKSSLSLSYKDKLYELDTKYGKEKLSIYDSKLNYIRENGNQNYPIILSEREEKLTRIILLRFDSLKQDVQIPYDNVSEVFMDSVQFLSNLNKDYLEFYLSKIISLLITLSNSDLVPSYGNGKKSMFSKERVIQCYNGIKVASTSSQRRVKVYLNKNDLISFEGSISNMNKVDDKYVTVYSNINEESSISFTRKFEKEYIKNLSCINDVSVYIQYYFYPYIACPILYDDKYGYSNDSYSFKDSKYSHKFKLYNQYCHTYAKSYDEYMFLVQFLYNSLINGESVENKPEFYTSISAKIMDLSSINLKIVLSKMSEYYYSNITGIFNREEQLKYIYSLKVITKLKVIITYLIQDLSKTELLDKTPKPNIPKQTYNFKTSDIISYLFQHDLTNTFDDTFKSLFRYNLDDDKNDDFKGNIFEKLAKYNSPKNKLQITEIAINEGTTKPFIDAILTETIQNSIDAIRETNSIKKINIFLTLCDNNLVYTIQDFVGMNENTLISLMVPFLSSKTASEIVTGEMGSGFFNVYRESSLVIIDTIKNRKNIIIYDTPIKINERVVDVNKKVSITNTTDNNNTKISIFIPFKNNNQKYDIISRVFYYVRNVLGLIVVKDSDNNIIPIDIKFNGDSVQHELLLIYSTKEFSMYLSKDCESYILTKGIPFREFYSYFYDKNIIANCLVESLNMNVLLYINHGIYTPIQTRTKINMSSDHLIILQNFLYNAGYYAILEMIINDQISDKDKYIPNFTSISDISQLLFTIGLNINHESLCISNVISHFIVNHKIKDKSIADIIYEWYKKFKNKRYDFIYPREIDDFFKDIDSKQKLVVIEWLKTKNSKIEDKVLNKDEKVEIVKNLSYFDNLFNKFIKVYWKIGKDLGISGFDTIVPVIELKSINDSILGFYSNNKIVLNSTYIDKDWKNIKIPDDIQSLEYDRTYSQFLSMSKKASTLIHEIEHARRHTSHDSSGAHDNIYETFPGDTRKYYTFDQSANEVYRRILLADLWGKVLS